jgi:phage shock protein A
MGILDRVATLIRANINDLIDRAEDPEKMVKQLIQDMENQLISVRTQVAAAIADEQRLKERWQEAERNAAEWQRKAELAVQKGDDDLAREALARRNTYAQTAAGFREQYEEQARQVEQLKDALEKLESKLNEARTKRDLLIARSRRAKAERQISETMARVDTSGVTGAFERIEEKVRAEEARAKALSSLDRDTLDERFAQLEQESELDRQLAELKRQLGKAPEPSSLPPAGGTTGSQLPSGGQPQSPGLPPTGGSGTDR